MNIFFEKIYFQGQWQENICITTDSEGRILSASQTDVHIKFDDRVNGVALPGFYNAHSHAFQYAIAGLAESLNPLKLQDDFWSWRSKMYQLALKLNPEDVEVIATHLYTKMLTAGYTWVTEFHYLHNDTSGVSYKNPAEMGEALLRAAQNVGIGITLVPILYQKGGFDKEPSDAQRRFISRSIDEYFKIIESSNQALNSSRQSIGWGVHSLRAVAPEKLSELVSAKPKDVPFHIHIAEQLKEIEDCKNHLGARPIEWLFNHLEVDNQWHLVHATHALSHEVADIVKSRSHVVLCPSTEANLGDGIFPLVEYNNLGGGWSIGSDSHVLVSPIEELRWLEQVQRLVHQKRNVLASSDHLDSGQLLFDKTYLSGRAAGGLTPNPLDTGDFLDVVVFNSEHPLIATNSNENLISSIIYCLDSKDIAKVMTGGKWRHPEKQLESLQKPWQRIRKNLNE